MAKQITYHVELKDFKEYIKSESTEDSKRHLLFPVFKKLYGEKLKSEADANGADVYVEGKLIVEAKTSYEDWLKAFYQSLHYQKKFGLAYTTLVVIAHKFVAIWKVNNLPEPAVIYAHQSDVNKAPNIIGTENAKRTTNILKKEIQESAIYWLDPKMLNGNFFKGEGKSLEYEIYEILNILKNIDSDRVQVNTHNFIQSIEYFKKFFIEPIDAVHCFYTIVAYWDITSTVTTNEYQPNEFRVNGFKGKKNSDLVIVNQKYFKDLEKYIESHYIFTNEGSGLTVDYYFSRFDEVMAAIDPEYVKQHGIFFTDSNLSKFALWFAKRNMENLKNFPYLIEDDYIVFDPAGGSGNLISSWKGKLKHKIISELQPDLLRTIERRMRIDPWHVETGFTIIPKTSENIGLNFLEHDAEKYLNIVEGYLKEKNLSLDKPLALLLNPPYKNTKENVNVRDKTESNYSLHKSIIDTTGEVAVNERYLAFLGQILNISKIQKNKGFNSIVLIFTPTSWLIPRKDFIEFRKTWDSYFEFISGFIVRSDEFFKVDGKWPLAFTIWRFNNHLNTNNVKLFDFTHLLKDDLQINWAFDSKELDFIISSLLNDNKIIDISKHKECIRDKYKLKLYDYIHTPSQIEIKNNPILGGLPFKDERRKNKKTYGIPNSDFIGFMDDITPVRIKPRGEQKRFTKSNLLSVWFRLDTAIKDANKSKCLGGAADNRSYCAYDLESAKATFSWYSISKAINGKYPLWANQYDIWSPKIKPNLKDYWYSLCFAFVLSINSCVVTKFEKDNPVKGAPEVFVDNPLCPTNKESFWSLYLDKPDSFQNTDRIADELVNKITELYKTWNFNYCKGQFLYNVGLKDEPYFKYFNYDDFLTPYSGLIQIKKYAQNENLADLLDIFKEIQELSIVVKDEIYRLLVEEFNYFD